MTLAAQVHAALRRAAETTGHDLFNEPVVLGVSGGPDSLTLLHLMRAIRRPEGLIVAHLDHGLRPGSAEEALAVAAAAGGLRFHSQRVDVADTAQVQGQSIEEAGRQVRYTFLANVARQEGAAVVAVGHNAGDQAETILMHLLRGSGLSGLAGMQEIGPLAGHEGLWLVRPLLSITRGSIEAYCNEHDLNPIIDASNLDPVFFRNRLRHELLPLLESYNPQIEQRLRHMGEIISADEKLLRETTDSARRMVTTAERENNIELNRAAWLGLPLALRRRTLRQVISRLQPQLRDIGFGTLESARAVAEAGETGATATLPGGMQLQVSYGSLLVKRDSAIDLTGYPQLPAAVIVTLPNPGKVILAGGWYITAEWIDDVDEQTVTRNRDPWTAYLDPGSKTLKVRTRQRGERMRPLGLGDAAKLKDIMINRKIPAAARSLWPIVATDDHVVWLTGHLVDDRARVRPGTGRVVRLRCISPRLQGFSVVGQVDN